MRKKVKLLLEQLQVCIFAERVFGVRCTLKQNRGTFFAHRGSHVIISISSVYARHVVWCCVRLVQIHA